MKRIAALVAVLLLVGFGLTASDGSAARKGGKIHVCVTKKGPDKGVMHFVKAKKCPHGQKSLSWNKKGMPGPAGPAGPAGAPGGASQDTIDQLRTQIEQQSAQITTLTSQLDSLTSQYTVLAGQLGTLTGQVTGVGSQLDTFKTAACDQLGDLTDQSNLMGTALDRVALGGTIPALLTLVSPAAPTALSPFSC